VRVTEAGVDTWSLSWYADRDGRCARYMRQLATVPGARGSRLLPESIAGHRVGMFPTGLLFAEGRPDPGGLCRPSELTVRALEVQQGLIARGVPLEGGERPFMSLGDMSEGWAGLRRLDVTVNVDAATRAEGLALLAGIAACVRDAPGQAEVRYGLDRHVETVYLRGYGGKRVLGRWYDKGLESASDYRGLLIRAEDQRRWGKLDRRDPWELDAAALAGLFRRRFYALWQATKGVRVAGPVVLAERLVEAVAEGRVTPQQATVLCGHLMLKVVAGRNGAGIARSTMYRYEKRARELGLVVADGVLEEVEVDLGDVLERVLDTDAWERRG